MRKRGDDTVASKPTEEKSMKSEKQLISRSFWRDWVKWGLIALCTLFVTTSYVQRICPGFTRYLFYQHGLSFFVDLRHPTDLGLNHTVNMYLTSEAEVTLGVWHTVPDHMWKEAQGKSLAWYEQSLGNGSPVFIYNHGNAGNRASPPHRVGVSKILSALGYHVLVMDYRGFGDSTGEPTVPGLVTDALYLYHWVRARSKGSQVFIWGHSIGTGVTTSAVVKLQEQGITALSLFLAMTQQALHTWIWGYSDILYGKSSQGVRLCDISGSPPDAVILEGSFLDSKVPKGVPHPFLWYYWRFPYIQYYFSQDTIKANKVQVSNSENLKQMRTPLMILHSKDDHLTPIRMAEELYKTAKSVLPEEKVRLVAFEASHGYRHNGLYRDPRLPKIIREFVQSNAK